MLRRFALVLALFAGLAGSEAQAAFIPGLFTTGVNNANVVLPLSSNDPHYIVLNGSTPNSPGVVMSSLPSTYVPNNSTSLWIWENASGQPTNVTRTFRTTFDLTGFVPTTATLTGTWSTDNFGLNILLNGNSTGITSPGFGAFTAFAVSNPSFFVSGVNTLDFVVQDVGSISGFRVGELSGQADARVGTPVSSVPLPPTLLVAAAGFALIGRLRRRAA